MNPRLVVLSGPQEGRTFPLGASDEPPFRIGRHPDNDLQLPTVEVSRHHCEVRREAEGHFRVVDLGSRHGVFVNSRPVRERRLAHSDLLSVGATVLLFLLDDTTAVSTPAPGDLENHPMQGISTLVRKPTEILFLDRDRMEAALPALPEQARIARDLHALLRASSRFQGARDLKSLASQLLEAAREVIPARRLAVLLWEAGTESPIPLAVSLGDGTGTETETARFDPTLLRDVLVDRDRLTEARLVTGESAAFLLAPLLDASGAALGVIYGDSPSPTALDERHLELLGALASLATPAFQNALHLRTLERENRRLRAEQLQHDLVGETPAMERLLDLIARVARADTTVLVRGESGTGKELVAQAIHRSSPRAEAPFVAINCATLSETLTESELFGHEKGAFTGAVARAIGKFEVAHRGTLFLDEVGEIPVGLQAKLLRVLQERQITRLGGTRPIATDVRVVAATNRDLEAAIREGTFREDLYYRLKVITLETPPLRARRDDIPLLAHHFLALHGRRLGRRAVTLSPAARRCLLAYPWPGNVRELGNALERALVLGEADTVQPEDLPAEVVEGSQDLPNHFQEALVEYKRRLILDAWKSAGGDYGGTADLLGVHVNSLHRMIRRLGLKDHLQS